MNRGTEPASHVNGSSWVEDREEPRTSQGGYLGLAMAHCGTPRAPCNPDVLGLDVFQGQDYCSFTTVGKNSSIPPESFSSGQLVFVRRLPG